MKYAYGVGMPSPPTLLNVEGVAPMTPGSALKTPWDPGRRASFTWHDCSDLSTIRQAASRCDLIDDKSGNLRHLVQNTFNRRPYTGFFINGLHTLAFDTNATYIETNLSGSMDTVTIISIYQQDTVADRRPGGLRGVGSPPSVTFAPSNDNTVRYDGSFQAATIAPTTGRHIRVTIKTLTRQRDYIDGVLNFDVNLTKPASNLIINMGNCQATLSAGSAFGGLVGDMIILNEDLSDSNRWLYEGYLEHKYNTDLLPANHIYKINAPKT